MGVKNHSRSFRYSDEVAKILEAFEGKSLNEKFENLVLYCHSELPKLKREVSHYQKLVEKERQKYYQLCEKIRDAQALHDTLRTLQQIGTAAAKQAKSLFEEV